MDNFEKASRLKLRWEVPKGSFDSEDLWDLELKDLNTLGLCVKEVLKGEAEESLLSSATRKAPTHNDLRLSIIKHIIAVKEERARVGVNRAESQARIARLKELAAQKSDEELTEKSREDILTMIAEEQAKLEVEPEMALV